MDPVTSVLTAFVDNESEARKALKSLRPDGGEEGVALVAAAVITLRGSGDALHLHLELDEANAWPGGQEMINTLFPPSILALSPVGRQANAASSHYESIGIEGNLLKEIGENLSLESAALLVVVSEQWLKNISAVLKPKGMLRFTFADSGLTRQASLDTIWSQSWRSRRNSMKWSILGVLLASVVMGTVAVACSDDDEPTAEEARAAFCTDLEALQAQVQTLSTLSGESTVGDVRTAEEDLQAALDDLEASAADVAEISSVQEASENLTTAVEELDDDETISAALESLQPDSRGA